MLNSQYTLQDALAELAQRDADKKLGTSDVAKLGTSTLRPIPEAPPLPAKEPQQPLLVVQSPQGGAGLPQSSQASPGGGLGLGNLGQLSKLKDLFGGGAKAGTGGEGAAGAAGGGGGFSSFGGPLLYAKLIGEGKLLENKNPNSVVGRGLLSGLGPSFNQVKADPKLAVIPHFLHGWLRNKKAAKAKPEWAGLFKSL